MIDLRSDTVTVPSPEMREAMARAEVGDDVIDVDPTVARLQETIAEALGKSAALFMPSGSMTNQTAVRLHCQPGGELLCEAGCHIHNYEQGAHAQLSGVAVQPIEGQENQLSLADLQGRIRPDDEHAPPTRLLTLENTHNRGGGRILPYETVVELCDWARQNGLKTHLDGARLFNAVVATGIPASQWAQHFDTISICFSKGLGAPVGSALVCDSSMVPQLRRHRKLFGGAMRQSGIIAAGALFALQNNIDRLVEDHTAAQHLAQAVEATEGLSLDPKCVDTNIVIFKVASELGDAPSFCKRLYEAGVWVFPFSKCHVRAVTHLNVTQADAKRAGEIIADVARQACPA